MMMFAGAAAAALDVLASLASSASASSRAAQNGSAAQGFDIADTPAAAEVKAGTGVAGPVPALSSDTMNALLQSLFDGEAETAIGSSEAKSALAKTMKLVAQQAQARAAALSGHSLAMNV
jgi:hypothetical protein